MKPELSTFLDTLPESPETACAYFPDRKSTVKAFISNQLLPGSYTDSLMASGYRRVGNYFYQPTCKNCKLCLSYRVDVKAFKPSKSQHQGRSKIDGPQGIC